MYHNSQKNTGGGVRLKLFHDGGPYHMETNPLICYVKQWSGFYMIET